MDGGRVSSIRGSGAKNLNAPKWRGQKLNAQLKWGGGQNLSASLYEWSEGPGGGQDLSACGPRGVGEI